MLLKQPPDSPLLLTVDCFAFVLLSWPAQGYQACNRMISKKSDPLRPISARTICCSPCLCRQLNLLLIYLTTPWKSDEFPMWKMWQPKHCICLLLKPSFLILMHSVDTLAKFCAQIGGSRVFAGRHDAKMMRATIIKVKRGRCQGLTYFIILLFVQFPSVRPEMPR